MFATALIAGILLFGLVLLNNRYWRLSKERREQIIRELRVW